MSEATARRLLKGSMGTPPVPAAAIPGMDRQPMIPPTAIKATCRAVCCQASMATAAVIAMVARVRSGARVRAMPHTAKATTATAATFRPCSHPASTRSNVCTP